MDLIAVKSNMPTAIEDAKVIVIKPGYNVDDVKMKKKRT